MALHRKLRDSLVGSVLADAYRIVRILGEGGMATVYEAIQLRPGARVAVKVMAHSLAGDPEALARFRREAELMSEIRHPHIVEVFDSGVTPDGDSFLAMELLEGEDLEQRLRRAGRLSPSAAAHIVKQAAAALAAAHARGIVHRDLKPANIYLLDRAGEQDFVKLLDFGVSKVQKAVTLITLSPRMMGTPRYMSPEQAQGLGKEVDDRSDQWALACIAWEMLAGGPPFAAEDEWSLLYRIVFEPPSSSAAGGPRLSARVEQVLRRALAKDKRDRFASVTDFACELDAAVMRGPGDTLTGREPGGHRRRGETGVARWSGPRRPPEAELARMGGAMRGARAPGGGGRASSERLWMWLTITGALLLLPLLARPLLDPPKLPELLLSSPPSPPVTELPAAPAFPEVDRMIVPTALAPTIPSVPAARSSASPGPSPGDATASRSRRQSSAGKPTRAAAVPKAVPARARPPELPPVEMAGAGPAPHRPERLLLKEL